MRCVILLIILFFVLPFSSLQATTYYVDPVSGDNGDDGLSEGNAWATVLYAHDNAGAGDTIYLMDGATHGDVTITTPNPAATTWSNKITFTKAPGDDPNIKTLTINPSGYKSFYIEFNDIKIRPIGGGTTPIDIDDSSSLRFVDLSVQGVWNENYVPADASIGYDLLSNGILVNSTGAELIDDITFDGCTISQLRLGVQLAGKFGDSAGDIQIIDCNIHTVARSQIILAFTNDATNGHVLIQGNHLHNQYQFNQVGTGSPTHGSGVAIKCCNVTVKNNIVHSTGTTTGIGSYSNGGQAGVGYSDVLIENNLLYDIMNGTAMYCYDVSDSNSYVVRNNTIIGAHNTGDTGKRYYGGSVFALRPIGFYDDDGIDPAECSGLKIHNNIVVGMAYWWGNELNDDELGGFEEMEEDYNYLYSGNDANNDQMSSHDNTVIVVDDDTYNSFFESGGFFVDPDVNQPGGSLDPRRIDLHDEYKLLLGSAGIDIGDSNNAPERDLLGLLRGVNPDVGCYEYPADADANAPTPNPATWSVVPFAYSSTAISMTATIGVDASETVYYYFDETSGNSGGSDSGWVTNPNYIDSGLTNATEYTYTVQMRDSQPTPNVGTASDPASATTSSVAQYIILKE
ncbi:MAG: right-handed parallel beta-helix repeat-containing protein [Planctomycetota bacterium]|jgi:hypothetical protein